MTRTAMLVPATVLLAFAVGCSGQRGPVNQPPGATQEDTESLRQEIQQLKAGQAAMRRQLTEIRNLVQRGGQQQARREPVVPDVTIDLAGYPFKGQADAPITLVEYSDYQ